MCDHNPIKRNIQITTIPSVEHTVNAKKTEW